jgi:hypothetical protein
MRAALALALAGPLLLVACSQGTPADDASSPAKASAAASMESSAVPSEAPSAQPSDAPSAPSLPPKPSADGMATDRLADAVLEQLKIDSADTFTDQLITIALSPLMRQFASTADVTTRVDSDGPKVKLTMSGLDSTCVITVTDEPRARGVVCKTV